MCDTSKGIVKLSGFGSAAPRLRGLLTIELVPSTSWGDNLRSRLSKADWDRLRKEQYRLAGHRCEICGGKGTRHPVECHEIWAYDDVDHVQKLVSLIALCPLCHSVKHMGRSIAVGQGEQAAAHMSKVNQWSSSQTQKAIREAFATYHERSKHPWTLDLSWLESRGIQLSEEVL